MNHRHFFRSSGLLSLCALSLWATTATLAQTAPTAPTQHKKPPATQTPPAGYQSAMEGYKPYKDEKIGNWKEANEVTARIGGWRAYATEAAQTEPDPHAGHAKPAQDQSTRAKP